MTKTLVPARRRGASEVQANSKCHTELLETPVTCSKQTTAILPTSHKIALREIPRRTSKTVNPGAQTESGHFQAMSKGLARG